MLQVATFLLPKEQDEANEFLATHKVASTNFNKDMIVVFVEDGVDGLPNRIADLNEFIQSANNAKFQQEISLHVLEDELAKLEAALKKLNAARNKGRFDETMAAIGQRKQAIDNVKEAIAVQDLKIAFVEKRIKKLEVGS
jgi:uncharacterized protein YydD (DUF2326 family)